MKKNIYIYDNNRHTTGIYASENLICSYEGGDCEEITVEIPDDLEPYETQMGFTAVMIDGSPYNLNEVLRVDKNDHPYIVTTDPFPRKLKVISRNGRRSCAMTL